jgi:hypothetical protein
MPDWRGFFEMPGAPGPTSLRYNDQSHRSEKHSRLDDWLANLPADGVRDMCPWKQFCRFARESERRKVGVGARIAIGGTSYQRKLEACAQGSDAQAQAEYESKLTSRQAKRDAGKKPGGKDPEPPSGGPQDKVQINLTDEQSRIMKTGGGFDQCYNAQAAVDTGSMLIIASFVTQAGNDSQQLKPMLAVLERQQEQLGRATHFVADTEENKVFNEPALESRRAHGAMSQLRSPPVPVACVLAPVCARPERIARFDQHRAHADLQSERENARRVSIPRSPPAAPRSTPWSRSPPAPATPSGTGQLRDFATRSSQARQRPPPANRASPRSAPDPAAAAPPSG